MSGLRVQSFDRWCPSLDSAVCSLPEHPEWSHDLFTEIIDTFRDKPLRILLWTKDEDPVGLVAFMRSVDAIWEPVTQWLLPGYIGPIRSDHICDILRSIPFTTEIGWWRWNLDPPPVGGRIREVTKETTYGLDCSEDFQAFWRTTRIFKEIRRSRNRCAPLRFGINAPGAVNWIITGSDRFWCDCPSPQTDAKLVTVRRLRCENRLFTVSLHDGSEFVCGHVVLVHRRDAVAYMTFRSREQRFARLGAGSFLLCKVFEHARHLGLHAVDIGGGHEYKKRWARPMSCKAVITVQPWATRTFHVCKSSLRHLLHANPTQYPAAAQHRRGGGRPS